MQTSLYLCLYRNLSLCVKIIFYSSRVCGWCHRKYTVTKLPDAHSRQIVLYLNDHLLSPLLTRSCRLRQISASSFWRRRSEPATQWTSCTSSPRSTAGSCTRWRTSLTTSDCWRRTTRWGWSRGTERLSSPDSCYSSLTLFVLSRMRAPCLQRWCERPSSWASQTSR